MMMIMSSTGKGMEERDCEVFHIQLCIVHTLFLSNGPTAHSSPGPPHYGGFTITLRYTTLGRTPLDEWSARRRYLYLTTDNTHKSQTCMPAGGIQTCNRSKRAAADPRLRPHGHWDRHCAEIVWENLRKSWLKIETWSSLYEVLRDWYNCTGGEWSQLYQLAAISRVCMER
jgi:hypothetical protein